MFHNFGSWLRGKKVRLLGKRTGSTGTAVRHEDKRRRYDLRPLLEQLEPRLTPSVSVVTDKPDYQPGASALFTASGFDPQTAVTFAVVDTSVTPNQVKRNWTVTDGSSADLDATINGSVQTSWYVDPAYSIGASFTVTATAMSEGVMKTATATFTDGSATPDHVSVVWTPGQRVVSFEGTGTDTPVYEAVFINGARPAATGGSIQSGTLTSGSPIVTGMQSTAGLVPGQAVSGTGIPPGTTIAAILDTTHLTLSQATTASQTGKAIILSSAVATGLSGTSALYVGESVTGIGTPAGTTIVSIDSATQITLSHAMGLPHNPTT
jgi:hypothetical protein